MNMKKAAVILSLLLCATTPLNGCFGKFELTRKIYQVNAEVKDRFLRSALTWVFVILPVYGIAALVDLVAFNTIEFWSGNNPVAAGEKDFQYVQGDRRFDIHAVKAGNTVSYLIKSYKHGQYVDSLSIQWDLTTGNSKAVHREAAATTEYVASQKQEGVQLQIFNHGLQQVAMYR